jgi:hypothetical protein
VHLIPEFSDLIGLTYEMYSFGMYLPSIFSHIYHMISAIRAMDAFQESIGFTISDKNILKQVISVDKFECYS